MSGNGVQRWEDIIPCWREPSYSHVALAYHPSLRTANLTGAIISCCDVVDWDGDGGRDLLVSSWDACYDGVVRLFSETATDDDGAPRVGTGTVVDGVSGFASVVAEGGNFGLLTASRLRKDLWLFANIGPRSAPRFGAPFKIPLDADWLHDGELLHRAVFADIDGDGKQELVVGTDFWGDYWPDGLEWFEEGYTPYTAEGEWRGGPLRGHLYVFRNAGTSMQPVLGRGRPLLVDGHPIEVYGQAAPTFADLRGTGQNDLVCGDFMDRLHFFPALGGGKFGPGRPLRAADGGELVLDHCIHFPTAVNRDGQGRIDLVVTAEDGCVSFLRNTGRTVEGVPAFATPVSIQCTAERIRAGVEAVPAAADWTGNGLADLVVGNSAGEILFFPNLGQPDAPSFGREERLRAGGETIGIRVGPPGTIQGPAEIKFGYICPTVADWDGDGRPDVLAVTADGRHLFFRCARMGNPPEFESPRPLTFGGKPLRTVWRVKPAVVDWCGNGMLSYLCLDENGVLACYRRAADTVLDEKRLMVFDDGSPVCFTEDCGGGLGRIRLCVCDWSGTGRYDLLVGTHSRASVPPGARGMPRHTTGQAAILLLENLGSNESPRFAPPRPILHRGAPIRIGMHSCSPEAVDWRGRGQPDLLVGAEEGSLLWFKREDLS